MLTCVLYYSAEALDFVESASKDESQIVRKRQEYEEATLPFYLISPHSKFRLRWDVVSVSLISCTCLVSKLCGFLFMTTRADKYL